MELRPIQGGIMNIEELISKVKEVDIVKVAGNHFPLDNIGNKYLMHDPFTKETTQSICINIDTQMFYAFNNGIGGDVLNFVMCYLQKDITESIEYLLSYTDVVLSKEEIQEILSQNNSSKELILKMNYDAAFYFYCVLRRGKDQTGMQYFRNKRKLTDKTMNKFGVGFALNSWNNLVNYLKKKGYSESDIINSGLSTFNKTGNIIDKFRNRIIIPIQDVNGKVIAFGGRVLDDSKPKYLNSPDTIVFDKSKNLFALHLAKDSKREGFIACEGFMDVISMHQAGFDNAIASLGTAFTDRHACLIKSFRDVVYLAYDSDGPGTDATIKAINTLKKYNIKSFVIDMTPYKDPDDFIKNLGAEEFQKRIDAALPSDIFYLKKQATILKDAPEDEKDKIRKGIAYHLVKQVFPD